MKSTTMGRAAIFGLAVMQFTNAVGEAIPLREVLESFEKTGFPPSLLLFLVASKLAAGVGLLLPGFRRLKEWVFAGILIDILGAGASYVLAGHTEAFGFAMVPPSLALWGVAFFAFRRANGLPPAATPSTLSRWVDRVLAMGVLSAAVGELLRAPPVMASMEVIHFPEHTLTILATAKLLAVAALLVPGFPTLRSWARAGLAFNFAGALYSYAAVGVFLLPDVPLLLLLSVVLAVSTTLALRDASAAPVRSEPREPGARRGEPAASAAARPRPVG